MISHKAFLLFILLSVLVACGEDPRQAEPGKVTPAAEPQANPVVLSPDEGEYLRFPDGRYALLKVTKEHPGSKELLMGTEALPPGTAIPVHSHDGYEEILFVHHGAPHLTLEDSTFQAEPGTTMYIPPGTWHGVSGHSADSTTILFIFPETKIAEFFRTVGQGKGEAPPELGPEDWAKIMEQHQMRARPD